MSFKQKMTRSRFLMNRGWVPYDSSFPFNWAKLDVNKQIVVQRYDSNGAETPEWLSDTKAYEQFALDNPNSVI